MESFERSQTSRTVNGGGSGGRGGMAVESRNVQTSWNPSYSGQQGMGYNSSRTEMSSSSHQTRSASDSGQNFYMSSGQNSSGLHPAQLSPNSFYRTYSRTGSMASGIDGADIINQTPKFVRDTSKFWHKPLISRDEAITMLKDKPAGSFVIRNSSTFQGAYGLAVRVAQLPPNIISAKSHGDNQTELVRHFLIEPTSKGVRLKGCANEPTFGSLAALVYQHTITPLALPCKLLLPQTEDYEMEILSSQASTTTSQSSSTAAACNVLYLNSVDTESLTGPEAVSRALDATFNPQRPSPKTTVVHFKASNDGITLTDNKRRIFFRRHYPLDSITYCGLDARDRRFEVKLEDDSTVTTGRLFGFVAHKASSSIGIVDNSCHLFAELDPTQPASAIASFVTKLMVSCGHNTSSTSGGASREGVTSPKGILRGQ